MATVYIAETGDDSTGDGTETNPWATISKANTETVDGDTIIASGTFDLQTDGSFSEARTYKGYDATLIKSGTFFRTIGAINKDTVIEGFTWTGEHIGTTYRSAYRLNSGTGEIHIKNNKFIDIVGNVQASNTPSFFGRGDHLSLITTNIKITGCIISGMTSVNVGAGGDQMSFIGFRQHDDYPVNLSMIGNAIYLNKTGTDKFKMIFIIEYDGPPEKNFPYTRLIINITIAKIKNTFLLKFFNVKSATINIKFLFFK